MNITNKINMWNEVLMDANTKVKQVADQATGELYFEIAKYKDNNSMPCRAIKKIRETTGIDLRFSFINLAVVLYTTKHEANLEDFIKNYRFNINRDNFTYSNVTIKEFDAIKRSNALDKVMAKELPIATGTHTNAEKMKAFQHTVRPTLVNKPKGEYAVELDEAQKDLINELSKPQYKNSVKIVKAKE